MVVLNAFKVERAISTNTVFKLPTADTFAGLANFADALSSKGFLSAFWYSLVITVTSVVLILMLLNVRVVHHAREHMGVEAMLFPVCVLNGRTVPDAYVYTVSAVG